MYKGKFEYLGGYPGHPARSCTQSEVRIGSTDLEFHCLGLMTVVIKPLFTIPLARVTDAEYHPSEGQHSVLVSVQIETQTHEIHFRAKGSNPEQDAMLLRDLLLGSHATQPGRTITETRCTCAACGTVWHYGKSEEMVNRGKAMQQAGKSMMCCTGCFPAVLIPNQEVIDLNRCPTCGSRAVSKEQVVHGVPD